ncbi:MAG: hypothetical protein GY816_15015, partial [Cytophagales bacterium]|nr:hypothetical protein [Cytophagales bacterium]
HQREEIADENGEAYIETIPEDIEWASKLLRNVLFRKSDELSDACRKFYDYLKNLKLNKEGYYANEIREQSSIHPRTLNRYLNELTEFGRIRIIGGNKHKGGYKYQFAGYTSDQHIQDELDKWMDTSLKTINQAHQKQQKSKRKSA